MKAALLADRIYKVVEDLTDEDSYDSWADAVYAKLPPMSDEQIAAAARVFSAIDQRTEGGAANVA